jgi:hypothetical protein
LILYNSSHTPGIILRGKNQMVDAAAMRGSISSQRTGKWRARSPQRAVMSDSTGTKCRLAHQKKAAAPHEAAVNFILGL